MYAIQLFSLYRNVNVSVHVLYVTSPDDDYPDSYNATYTLVNNGKGFTGYMLYFAEIVPVCMLQCFI